MVSPATKKADLGGIDTPPSANYLVVHNPAKCSVFWRSTQGHGEISFPFGNHPPPHPLFSLRSQTATSQLAGFRNISKKNSRIQQKLVACCVCSCFFPCVSPFEKTVLQGQIQKLKSFLDVAHLHLAGTRHEYHRPAGARSPWSPWSPETMGRCERSP